MVIMLSDGGRMQFQHCHRSPSNQNVIELQTVHGVSLSI
jgi:hypothetical protein